MAQLGDALISTCVIARGELIFMAQRSERKSENIIMVQAFLSGMVVYSLDGGTADIYGDLKASILEQFGPKERSERRRTKIEALGVSDNDLWIAAVALQHSLTIVSADSDFKRISAARELQLETWTSPVSTSSSG
jgi:tRNA(fMet)-specific endonuclease VapC